MNYTFKIFDKNSPVNSFAVQLVRGRDFQPLYNKEFFNGNQYTVENLDLDGDNVDTGLMFYANGKNNFYSFSALFDQSQINQSIINVDSNYMYPQLPIVPILLGAGLLLAASDENKKVGEISRENVTTGFYIAGGVLTWVLLKKLLESLGILDPTSTVNLDNAMTDPNSFWNPNFWRSKPPNVNYTNPITLAQAETLSRSIYNAFSWYNDNEEQAIAVFKSLPSQAAASFLAHVFQQMYNADLLTFLRGGSWPQDRLSDSDVYMIHNYVMNLPKY